uniref:Ribosomal protein S7 n=1 Tax=Ophirina amphinema TaxID=2108040 RepID=A0A348AYQ3_9EUKA|nr:ribosomal protein S7 [Ophirina amphinema]
MIKDEVDFLSHIYVKEKFINHLMRGGKKARAISIFDKVIRKIQRDSGEDGMSVLIRGIDRVRPVLEIKSVRVGSSYYQVPVEISLQKQLSLATRWIVDSARTRSGRGIIDRITSEVIQASHYQGNAYKKKLDIYRSAESNRMFAHFRW